jgi:hypothetical protein
MQAIRSDVNLSRFSTVSLSLRASGTGSLLADTAHVGHGAHLRASNDLLGDHGLAEVMVVDTPPRDAHARLWPPPELVTLRRDGQRTELSIRALSSGTERANRTDALSAWWRAQNGTYVLVVLDTQNAGSALRSSAD